MTTDNEQYAFVAEPPAITLTGARIAAMHDAMEGVISTPANEVYIAARTRSGQDACTRTVSSMLQEISKKIDDLRNDATAYTFAVEMFPIRVEPESESEHVQDE